MRTYAAASRYVDPATTTSGTTVCGGIVELTEAQQSGAPDSITGSGTITKALKFQTGVNTDRCEVVITYPGTTSGEKKGLFNGMLWTDFIKNSRYFNTDGHDVGCCLHSCVPQIPT